ncbi:MAG TPA: UBP-type zinc finger domain-containing protein [Anaerolineales bacterium]
MNPRLEPTNHEAGELRKRIQSGELSSPDCTHLDQIQDVTPSAQGCEDCLKTGDTWVHLRMCLICGHVGCCDDSKNKHATKHAHRTSHSLIISMEPGEYWLYCYQDDVGLMP